MQRDVWIAATQRDPRSRLDPRNLPADILEMVRGYTLPHVWFGMRKVPVPVDGRPAGFYRGEPISWGWFYTNFIKLGSRTIWENAEDLLVIPFVKGNSIIWSTEVTTFVYTSASTSVDADCTVETFPYFEFDAIFADIFPCQLRETIPESCLRPECGRNESFGTIIQCDHVGSNMPAAYLGQVGSVRYFGVGLIRTALTLMAQHGDGRRFYLTNTRCEITKIEYPIYVGNQLLDPETFATVGSVADGKCYNVQVNAGRIYVTDVSRSCLYRLE